MQQKYHARDRNSIHLELCCCELFMTSCMLGRLEPVLSHRHLQIVHISPACHIWQIGVGAVGHPGAFIDGVGGIDGHVHVRERAGCAVAVGDCAGCQCLVAVGVRRVDRCRIQADGCDAGLCEGFEMAGTWLTIRTHPDFDLIEVVAAEI